MDKVKPEDYVKPSDRELQRIGEVYQDYYNWRGYRSGVLLPFQNYSFEEYLTISRELFWNSMKTESDDLQALGLNFSIPFARKEIMDFNARMTALNVKPRISGDNLDLIGIKILQGIYKKWYFKSNQKVEKFWDVLYGIVNGTVCNYIGYNNDKLQRRYLDSFNPETGDYTITKKDQKPWDDVTKEIVALEDIYIPKIFERNIQKQGKLIWKTQMDYDDFKVKYAKYPLSQFVQPGFRIAEDSLYFRLLGGSGVTSTNKVEVLIKYDWINDELGTYANGIWLDKLGRGDNIEAAPMPFDHKMAPFSWGIMNPIDDKFAYGLSDAFLIKDPHKIQNTAFTMMVERELRAVDPPILSSDIEAPELIFGQHATIPVTDVNAYKELKISEPSSQFFTMMNSLQSNMTAQVQGGDTNIVPSIQPKSSREVMSIDQLKQQTMANSLTLYYDLVRQEVTLVLKTALQFYTLSKYENADKRVVREMIVSDMPITGGGVGNVKLRVVKSKQSDYDLFLESIKESVLNGKKTEIIEIPVEFIQNCTDFLVDKIDLESEKSSELEKQTFIENIIAPMLNTYVPAGVADIGKVYLRHLEKFGESPIDYSKDEIVNQLVGNGRPQLPTGQAQGMPGSQQGGAMGGNIMQMLTGTKFGMQNNVGINDKANI